MLIKEFPYQHDSQQLLGFIAYDDQSDLVRPAIMVAHDWSGRNDFACEKAILLAKQGYVGFAIDMFGEAKLGVSVEEKQALIGPLINDRQLLSERINSALQALLDVSVVDANKVAAIGFCFGGLCVLDLARSGANLKGVVSFHGLLNPPNHNNEQILAKVLVLHGYDDPMVPPEVIRQFCDEMTLAKVDWQVNMYGHTQHAFTNPLANDKNLGTIYNPHVEKRAFAAMNGFLEEIFAN